MSKTESKIIKKHQYTTSLFPAMQGYLIARELIAVFTATDPIAKLCEVDKDGELVLKLLSTTIRDDMAINKATFDNIYTGCLGELIEALKFIFEVNFKDFLQENVIGNLTEQIKAGTVAVAA